MGGGDDGRCLGELDGMGRGGGGLESDSCMRGIMKWRVQRLCLLPVWWRWRET